MCMWVLCHSVLYCIKFPHSTATIARATRIEHLHPKRMIVDSCLFFLFHRDDLIASSFLVSSFVIESSRCLVVYYFS